MILVTGITGRVGSSAARYLLDNGFSVRGLTRDDQKATESADLGAEIVVGDVSEVTTVKKAVSAFVTVVTSRTSPKTIYAPRSADSGGF